MRLEFDGSCGPTNPGGIAVASYILRNNGKIISSHAEEVGRYTVDSTNNLAEYSGLMLGLQEINRRGLGGHLEIRGDSSLVIQFLKSFCKGGFKYQNKPLTEKLALQKNSIISCIRKGKFSWDSKHIDRWYNQDADKLGKDFAKTLTAFNVNELRKIQPSHWWFCIATEGYRKALAKRGYTVPASTTNYDAMKLLGEHP